MEACGVNFDSANFSYWSSDYAERIFNTIRDGFLEDLNVAVVDSMGFLTSKKVMETDQVVEKGDKEAQMAATARMVADFMRKVKQPLFRTQGIIIVTNHVTTEIGGWKPRSVPAGGLKLQFGTSLRFRLFPKPIPEAQSIETKVTIDKSKDWDAVPWGTTSVDIVWRKGIDKIADIARLAKTSGIIEQKGAWIYYGGEKYQGFDSFKDAIRTNDRLRESLIQATSGVVPQEEEEVYIADEDGVIQET
jgi:recombination protein RecA